MTPAALLALRLTLAVVLLASGIGKLLDGEAAETLVHHLAGARPLTVAAAPWVVAGVALVELALALWLASGRAPRLAWSAVGAMVLLFTLALASLPLRGIVVPSCGCFGALLPDGSVSTALLRNAALLVVIAAGYFASGRRAGRKGDAMAA